MGLFSRTPPPPLPDRADFEEALNGLNPKDRAQLFQGRIYRDLLSGALSSDLLSQTRILAVISAFVGEGFSSDQGPLFVTNENLLFYGCDGHRKVPLHLIYDMGLEPISEKVFIDYGNKQEWFSLAANKRDSRRAFVQRLEAAIEEAQKSAKPSSSSTPRSSADELEKFAKLRDRGVLSDEEFEAKKRQILGL